MKQAELTLTFKVTVDLDPSEFIHPLTYEQILQGEINYAEQHYEDMMIGEPVVTGVIITTEE